jgi:hypothetical protein
MLSDRSQTLYIVSTRDPDLRPVCQLNWGQLEWYADVSDVRDTALDLVECAALADLMMLLVTKVGLAPDIVSRLMGDMVIASRPNGKRFFGTKATITLTPGGSSKRGEAVVMLQRGSMRGAVSPAEAREMAGVWFSAAEATESDRVVADALGEVGKLDEGWVDGFFALLRHLRGGGDVADGAAAVLRHDST